MKRSNVRRPVSQRRYSEDFEEKPRALDVALEARRFEIQLCWSRTTYFSTLSAAALAGFVALQASDAPDGDKDFFSFVVACVSVVLSFGWSLANKGSKFWHENWENHVQLLEGKHLGPLHKTLLFRPPPRRNATEWLSQLITGPAPFSVSKINALFSWFFTVLWCGLIWTVVPRCSRCGFAALDVRYAVVGAVAVSFVVLIAWLGRSWLRDHQHDARRFRTSIGRGRRS